MNDIARMEIAAEWLQRLHSSPQDEVLLKEWLHWCQSDAENTAASERVRSVWDSFDDPIVRESVREARSREPSKRARNRRIARTCATAATLSVAVGALWWQLSAGDQQGRALTTDVAEQGKQILSDGSKIDLAASTRIVARYTRMQRTVIIDAGEAFFQVKKDPGRPFIVQAGSLRVTAVGTAFSVQRGLDRTIVTVTEGVVRIEPNDNKSSDRSDVRTRAGEIEKKGNSGHQVQAGPGDQVTFIAASNCLTIDRVDPKAWWPFRGGILRFVDEPLKNVVAEINRHRTQPIILDDRRFAEELYTGTVYLDRIDDWLHALKQVFPVRTVEGTNGEIVLVEKN